MAESDAINASTSQPSENLENIISTIKIVSMIILKSRISPHEGLVSISLCKRLSIKFACSSTPAITLSIGVERKSIKP